MELKNMSKEKFDFKFDGKDIFCPFTADSATQFINQEGYFGDNPQSIVDSITNGEAHRLIGVNFALDGQIPYEMPFNYKRENMSEIGFRYFIPKSKVNFLFKNVPFKDKFDFIGITGKNVGDVITIRHAERKNVEFTAVITAMGTNREDNSFRVWLGNDRSFTFEELYNGWEYLKNGEWLHFGVKEKLCEE